MSLRLFLLREKSDLAWIIRVQTSQSHSSVFIVFASLKPEPEPAMSSSSSDEIDHDQERHFSRVLSRERVIIERVFGMVKRRFPLIGHAVRLKTESIPKVIVVAFVLHNISLDLDDQLVEDDDDEIPAELVDIGNADDEVGEAQLRQLGQQRRDQIAAQLNPNAVE